MNQESSENRSGDQVKPSDLPAKTPETSGQMSSQPSTPSLSGESSNDSDPQTGQPQGGGTGMKYNVRDDTIWRDDRYTMEDRRKAADLVLKKLDKELERGEVDADLLKELGWNQENLKQFQQRMSDYLRQEKSAEQNLLKQKQFEEMLQNMRLEGKRTERTGRSGGATNRDEFVPNLIPPPAEYREIEQAFRKSLSESQKP